MIINFLDIFLTVRLSKFLWFKTIDDLEKRLDKLIEEVDEGEKTWSRTPRMTINPNFHLLG